MGDLFSFWSTSSSERARFSNYFRLLFCEWTERKVFFSVKYCKTKFSQDSSEGIFWSTLPAVAEIFLSTHSSAGCEFRLVENCPMHRSGLARMVISWFSNFFKLCRKKSLAFLTNTFSSNKFTIPIPARSKTRHAVP